MGGQGHAPASLLPGKTRSILFMRLVGPQGQSGQLRKISLPPGYDSLTIRPVANRYTDYTIPAHLVEKPERIGRRGRPRRKWEYNVKMELQERGW
jgi:hypothetical protein